MDTNALDIETIVQAVMAELRRQGGPAPAQPPPPAPDAGADLVIDLPDPGEPGQRRAIGVTSPYDPAGLRNLCATTTARLGVGRAGPRPRTRTLLLFQADHAVTQDAIYGEVAEAVKARLNLFTVKTQVADRNQYLLRPDLGRRLLAEARQTIAERCAKKPQVQIVIGDGLSAAAVNNNVPEIYPVIEQGLKSAGISVGTPFFVQYARVGVINDINEVIGADLVVILIGERPGLGVADALSAYMGYAAGPGKTDADRDVVCMITYQGGTNPLEAGAYVVELIKKSLQHRASGVELKLKAPSAY